MIRLTLCDPIGRDIGRIELVAADLEIAEADLRTMLPKQVFRLQHGADSRAAWVVCIDHED